MRRWTLNFSMYSDMSMRTSAFSESNRHSASALASSVLPTPVGPRKKKLPMGRLGSERPARLRRTAAATALTASFWPMTRLCSSPSRFLSLSISPCIIFETGTPVQELTTSAISSLVTSSLSRPPSSCLAESAFSASSYWRCRSGMMPYWIWPARP